MLAIQTVSGWVSRCLLLSGLQPSVPVCEVLLDSLPPRGFEGLSRAVYVDSGLLVKTALQYQAMPYYSHDPGVLVSFHPAPSCMLPLLTPLY